MVEILRHLLSNSMTTFNSGMWQFLSFVLAVFVARKAYPYVHNASLTWKAWYMSITIGLPLLVISLLVILVYYGNLIVTQASISPVQSIKPVASATILLHVPTPTKQTTVKVKVTPSVVVQTGTQTTGQTGGVTQQNHSTEVSPTPKPKPTSTPTPSGVYPHTITVNLTTPCDNNDPDYIEGRINSVEIVSSSEVIYSITFFNKSDNNLGLNTYTMSLENDYTHTYSQAQQPSVPINAHSYANETYEFTDINITSNTTYTLSWDISEGNIFTCTFPNESLSY
jgi:hypothetical protein